MNIIDKFKNKPAETASQEKEVKDQEPAIEVKATEAEETLSDIETTEEVADPYAKWTKEDLVKEMVLSRNEAAKSRVEKKELEKKLAEDMEVKLKALEDKFTPHLEKSLELMKLQEKEADNKRTLEEKLSDREVKLAKAEDLIKQLEDKTRERTVELQSKLERATAELGAYESHLKEQLDKELAEIPAQHKSIADLIVKGSGENVQDALNAIKQAKSQNVFGTKTVKVYNGTPTAKTGARISAPSAQQDEKELSKNDKLELGLKDWKTKQRRRSLLDS